MPVARHLCHTLAAVALLSSSLHGADLKPYSGAGCAAVDPFFSDEVWAKVGALECLKCHKAGGDAEDSKLVLRDLSRFQGDARDEAMRQNWNAFLEMAKSQEGHKSRLLLKATGAIKHGGKQ